jgi:2'-5' RNA ligase
MRASFGSFLCDRLLMMKSDLGPGGARYTPLVEAPLSQK